MSEFDQLQKDVQKTAVYPDHWGVLYPAIGLVDEACELLGKIKEFYFPSPNTLAMREDEHELFHILHQAEMLGKHLGKFKKRMRGDNDYQFHEDVVQLSTQRKAELQEQGADDIAAELGDVMWYASEVSRQIQISLQEVCERMTQKLADRAARNVIKGNGDNR